MSSSCDPGTGCIIVAQWKRLPRVRISRGLPWPSWPERTANNHKVRGSSLRDGSVLLIESQNPSCLSRGSHSSVGQSVRPITVRSAVQARVGPLCSADNAHSIVKNDCTVMAGLHFNEAHTGNAGRSSHCGSLHACQRQAMCRPATVGQPSARLQNPCF